MSGLGILAIAAAIVIGVVLAMRQKKHEKRAQTEGFHVCRQCDHPYSYPNVPRYCRRCGGPVERPE